MSEWNLENTYLEDYPKITGTNQKKTKNAILPGVERE